MLLLTAGLLTGCQSFSPERSIQAAHQLAQSHGFTHDRFDTGRFPLSVYHRGLDSRSDQLVIYIEGDGRSFITRRRVSSNPTPADPVALKMAVADPSTAVAYVARPCQFNQPLPDACKPRYWTSHRYAEVVLTAMNGAIDSLKKRSGAPKLGLVGYSGGGSVAALLAERRADINWLVTVAANLDHAAWTEWHGDTPLHGSLNPVDGIEQLADMPQLHIAGREDETVPPALIQRFIQKLPARTPVEFMLATGIGHHGWPAFWQREVCELAFWRALPACQVD